MIELTGKYNSCKVFTDNCDNECISQLLAFLNQNSCSESKIRIMPDCHAGAGCVIGTTMTLHGKAIPNLVGVDIGCGVLAVKLKEKRIDLPNLDSVIRNYVPYGFSIHDEARVESDIENLYCASRVSYDRAYKSIGTLGGGNHFIEIDHDDEGNLYLIIHTGSRHLGIEVCSYYQDEAYEKLKKDEFGDYSQLAKDLISRLKCEGREKEISKQLGKLKESYRKNEPSVPHALAYLTGDLFKEYIHDMKLVQGYAAMNRDRIARIVLGRMKLHEVERFESIHNYVDTDNMILRKGAVSARAGEKLIVPINMRDGSLICVGKGNPEWNYSAPHGAGRLMSRNQAKESISMSDFRKSMEGIYTTCVDSGTIDESPMAYKPIDDILANIGDTVRVERVIKPIYNFKASDG